LHVTGRSTEDEEEEDGVLDRPHRVGFRLERKDDLEGAEELLPPFSLFPNILLLAAHEAVLEDEVGVEPLNVRISVLISSLLLLRPLLRLGGFLRLRTSLNRI
jgi:hypothetical protein